MKRSATSGFVTAAYIALFVGPLADLIFVLAVGVAAYHLVTRVLTRQVILGGRR